MESTSISRREVETLPRWVKSVLPKKYRDLYEIDEQPADCEYLDYGGDEFLAKAIDENNNQTGPFDPERMEPVNCPQIIQETFGLRIYEPKLLVEYFREKIKEVQKSTENFTLKRLDDQMRMIDLAAGGFTRKFANGFVGQPSRLFASWSYPELQRQKWQFSWTDAIENGETNVGKSMQDLRTEFEAITDTEGITPDFIWASFEPEGSCRTSSSTVRKRFARPSASTQVRLLPVFVGLVRSGWDPEYLNCDTLFHE